MVVRGELICIWQGCDCSFSSDWFIFSGSFELIHRGMSECWQWQWASHSFSFLAYKNTKNINSMPLY